MGNQSNKNQVEEDSTHRIINTRTHVKKIDSMQLTLPLNEEPYKKFVQYEEHQRRKNVEEQILSKGSQKKRIIKGQSQERLSTGFQTARLGMQSSESQSTLFPQLHQTMRQSVMSPDKQNPLLSARAERTIETLKSVRSLSKNLGSHTYRASSQQKNFELKVQHNHQQMHKKEQELINNIKQSTISKNYEETKDQFSYQQLVTRSIPKLIKCADRVLNKIYEDKTELLDQFLRDQMRQQTAFKAERSIKNTPQLQNYKTEQAEDSSSSKMFQTLQNFMPSKSQLKNKIAKQEKIAGDVFQYTSVDTGQKQNKQIKIIEVQNLAEDEQGKVQLEKSQSMKINKMNLNLDLKDIAEQNGNYLEIKHSPNSQQDILNVSARGQDLGREDHYQLPKNAYKDIKFYRKTAKNYFFPLEIFDDEARDDPDPNQLILSSHQLYGYSLYHSKEEEDNFFTTGKAPFESQLNTLNWEKCQILSYDENTRLFEIKFSKTDNEIIKMVKRQNLVYEFEDLKAFQKRLQKAKEKQKVHECLVRYTGHLLKQNQDVNFSNQKNNQILIQPAVIERIIQLTNGKVNQNIAVKFDIKELKSKYFDPNFLRKLTEDFLKYYRFTIIKHSFDQENMNILKVDYFMQMQEKDTWTKLRFIKSIILGSRRLFKEQLQQQSDQIDHREVIHDLKNAEIQGSKRRITDTMLDLISFQQRKMQTLREVESSDSMSHVKEETGKSEQDEYYDEIHASKTRRLERQMSDHLIDMKKMVSEQQRSMSQSSENVEDDSSLKDELDENEYSEQFENKVQVPDFQEDEDEQEFKDKILSICTDIELNQAFSSHDKQEQLLSRIILVFKEKRNQNSVKLEKLKPKNLALVHVIFPKIIRYIKSISEINLFKGFQIVQDNKVPLTLRNFEESIIGKQSSQINKVKSICQTAENTLNNMMYDLGLYNSRILSLCEDYILLQLSEQRKLLELSEIPELEDKIKELEGQTDSLSRKIIQKKLEKKRTFNTMQSLRKQQSIVSQKTLGNSSMHKKTITSPVHGGIESLDKDESQFDSENLVKEVIIFYNKQYHMSGSNTWNINQHDRNPFKDILSKKCMNLMYKFHIPYSKRKIAPLVRLEMISRKRFTILKRTLMTPNILKRKTEVHKKKGEEAEEEEDRELQKEQEKKLLIDAIICNSLFGQKIKANQHINKDQKMFKIPHLKGAFTISVGDLSKSPIESLQQQPIRIQTQIENGQDEIYSANNDIIDESFKEESNQSFNEKEAKNTMGHESQNFVNVVDDDNYFLVSKIKKFTIQDVFNLINKDFHKMQQKEQLVSRLNTQLSNNKQNQDGIDNLEFQADTNSPNNNRNQTNTFTDYQDDNDYTPQDFLSKYFPWFSESDFQHQAIFFKPTFKTLETKLKQLILDPITKLQSISVIKAPEIIDDPYKKQEEDFIQHISFDLEKVKHEIDTVLSYTLLGPLSLLALLRQFDYLILYTELDYLKNVELLAEQDDLDTLYQEYKLIKTDEYEIGLKFPSEISFGLMVVDIGHLKKEMIMSCDYLAKYITNQIKKKFLMIQETSWKQFDVIKTKLQQSIDTKEIFIEIKKYITNSSTATQSELELDIDSLKQMLKKCKKLENLFQKFMTYIDEKDYERYWMSYQWEWRIKQFKNDTIIRMNRCIEKFKQEVIQEADIVKSQIGVIGRQINEVYKKHFDMENAEDYARKISDAVDKLKVFREKSIKINDQEIILGLPPTNYSEIDDFLSVGEPLKALWQTVKNWHIENDKYLNLYFIDLNKDEIEQNVKKFYETIDDLDDKLNFQDTNSPKIVLEKINKELDDFCESCMPVILGLISEKIRQRHWNELRDHLYAPQINQNINTGLEGDLNSVPQLKANEITLKYLLEENITTLIPIIQQIREKAEKEFENEIYIETLTQEIKNYEVNFVTTKEGNILIKDARDHANMLQDYNFNSKIKLKNDIYILPFEEHLKELQFKLKTMKHYMEQIDRLQKSFLILSEAFRLNEIQKALKNEYEEFEEIDKEFYEKMKVNSKVQNFLQNVTEDEYLRLRQFNEKLRTIRLNFKKYFSDRRERFPRFFFLSDQQLMNLTCSQNNPKQMNIYLRYCFKGVKELVLDQNQEKIIGCIGVKNEIITFLDPIEIKAAPLQITPQSNKYKQEKGDSDDENDSLFHQNTQEKVNVEICSWMQDLEHQIKWTMKNVIRRCIIERDDHHIEEWFYNQSFNEQTYLVVESIKFNYDVTQVFNKDGLSGLKQYLTKIKTYAKTIINFIHFDDVWTQDKENNVQAPRSNTNSPLQIKLQPTIIAGSHQSKQSLQELSLTKQQFSENNISQRASTIKPMDNQILQNSAKHAQESNITIEKQTSEEKDSLKTSSQKNTQVQKQQLKKERQEDKFRSSRRLVFESLYLQKLQQIELLELLIMNNTSDLATFDWLSQLKFSLEIEQHRLDEKQMQLDTQLQNLKKQQTFLEQLTLKTAKDQRFNEASKREKVLQQQQQQTNSIQDEINNLVPVLEEEKSSMSLGMALRRRLRMEVEAQALKAEQEKLNVERVLRLQKLYANILEIQDQNNNNQQMYFEYSADYNQLKKDKKDYTIYAYLLSFTQQYGFEFNPTEGQMLVNTPLTQKTLYSLFQCVSSQIGGLIYGPQGVGKTETIQSLARTLAKPFLLWSCRGGCSYNGLSRIFAGMAIGGQWLCMDEINHLEIQILSTLIQQVLNIKHAVLLHKNRIEVNLSGGNIEVPFNRNFGLFATFTFNQAVSNNDLIFRESKRMFGIKLKNFPHIIFENFRTVNMLIPDIKVIINAKLMMLGFSNSFMLSTKIFSTLQLLSENMQPTHPKDQSSYDNILKYTLSLRSIDLIINKLKYLLRTFTFREDVTEDYIVANSIRGAFFYQMNPNQVEILDSIVSNIFKTPFNDIVAFSIPLEQKMNDAITQVIIQGQYASSDQILVKSKQFLNCLGAAVKTQQIRQKQHFNTIMIVGRTMSGKSELIKIVAKAYQKLRETNFSIHTFNTNSQNQDQFYGYFDTKGQWQEGLLPSLLIKCLTKLSEDQKQFLREDSFKSIYISDKNNENIQASTNVNEVKSNSGFDQGINKGHNFDKSQQHKRQQSTKRGKKTDSSNSEVLKDHTVNFATKRDWILLDGSVKENFYNSIHASWFERLLTLTENESEFICLSNGDSVHTVNSELKYIIETTSINHISPALLNRTQIISIDQDLIEDSMLFTRYLVSKQFPKYFNTHQSMLTRLINRIMLPLLDQINEHNYHCNIIIKQRKLIITDFIAIFQVLIDEFFKSLICSKKIDLQDQESNQGQSDSKNHKQKDSSISNLNLFDKFQIKYSMRARKQLELEKEKISYEQEISCLQSIFMESLKFTISNIVSSNYHQQTTAQLKQILQNLQKELKIDDNFANNFLEYLQQLQLDSSSNSFFLDHYYDYSSQKWNSFQSINPNFKYCTHSGPYKLGKRRFSISEEFRLNSRHRESKSNQLSQNEIDRKVNLKFDTSEELDFMYFDKGVAVRRNNYYFRLLQSYGKNIMVFGPIQSGKTALVRNKIALDMKFKDLRQSNINRYIPYLMNPLTKVSDLKRIVESNMEMQRIGVYVPPSKQSTYLFIDDVNMANPNLEKDSAKPLELLREYFELGGWYSRTQPRFNYIQQLQVIISYTTSNKHGDSYDTNGKQLNDRIMRHFSRLYIPSISRNDIKAIFSQYIEKSFESKHDKIIFDISKKLVDSLGAFIYKNLDKFYCDQKAFGFNISIFSTIQAIRKFVQIDLAKFRQEKIQILNIWFDLIKRQYLHQFPIIFENQDEKQKYNDRIFDLKKNINANLQQDEDQNSFLSDKFSKSKKSDNSFSDKSQLSEDQKIQEKDNKNLLNKQATKRISPNSSIQSNSSNDQTRSKQQNRQIKLQSFNDKVRQYIQKLQGLFLKMATDFYQDQALFKQTPKTSKTLSPKSSAANQQPQVLINQGDLQNILLKQVHLVNNDIFERVEDLNKSYDFDMQVMEEDHFKLVNREMKNQFRKFIFSEEGLFKHEFLRMDNSQYDKMIKSVLDIIRQLEETAGHMIIKANYEVDSSFIMFLSKIAYQFLTYTPYTVNISSPEFTFIEFLRDFNSKLEENILRKKTKMVLIVEMENYNLNHSLNDENRQEYISQFLYFLQAMATGSRFQNLLNYQEMKINLDKIRLREYTQQSYDYDNANEEQIMYCLNQDIMRNVKIVFISNHSRGGFLLDQILMHKYKVSDQNQAVMSFESMAYLAVYCKELFQMCRIINIDFMNYHEENLNFGHSHMSQKSQYLQQSFTIKKELLISLGKPEKINEQHFRNPFKINDQKYDRIIDSAYVTARKIQNIVNDIQQWEIDSSLEQDKQLVYIIFEKLMARYYKKHFQRKRNILNFLQKMKYLTEEINKIKEENQEQKDKKIKNRDDRNESNKTIDENKKQIEFNKKKSADLMKKSTERLNNVFKERKFKMMDLDHLENKFLEEYEMLKRTSEAEYEEFLQILRNGKGPHQIIVHHLSLTFILMFGTEKIKKKQNVKIEKIAPKFFSQKYTYQKFLEDLGVFSLQKKFASENIFKLQQLYEEAVDLMQKYGKQVQKFLRLSLSWFINAINYSKMKAQIDEFQVEYERETMEAEDQRSRAINLISINQQRQDEIKILDAFSKKLEKKIRKINNNISQLKDIGQQLKDIKKDLSINVKKWKTKIIDQPAPFEMTEGNMLYIALYFVFVMKFPSAVSAYLRDYILNLMLEWDLKFNIKNAIFQYVNLETKDFSEECSLFGIEENQRLYENLALIKLIKKFKLPFPFIYDPLGIAFKYIQNLEQSKGVEIEMMTIIEADDLDEENLKSPENKIFQYYQERMTKNETSFEKLVRCMENGIPVIIKDADVKTLKLIDSLITWRYKIYLREIRDKYYSKVQKDGKDFYDMGSNFDTKGDQSLDQDNSISDRESMRSKQYSTDQNYQQHQFDTRSDVDEEEIDTLHFNKAFVTIKKSFRLYMIFSSRDFQNIENHYRQRTTYINLAIEDDQDQMKDIILDVLMQQFQFEPYLITYLLKGHNYRIQREQLKKERIFFKFFRKQEINFRNQESINEIKSLIKQLKEIHQQKIKFVLENKYLKKYKALFEKVQKEMDDEEQNESNIMKDQGKTLRPGSGLQQISQIGGLNHKKSKRTLNRASSFDQDNLLQFYLKSPNQNQNKQAFDKLYHEILDSNDKQKKSFRQKILFATEPVYILWKTTQDVRQSIGNLYNYSDNFVKLLIQQTACELFTLSVTISNNSSRKDLANIAENLVLRMMHKLLSGLRKDHQVIFMFIFCVKLLQNEQEEMNGVKQVIIEKIRFLFNGLQIYQGDMLAMNYELKDFNRDPKWDYIKHKLQDTFNTIEGKILPIVNYKDIQKASDILTAQNLGIQVVDQNARDQLNLIQNIDQYISQSPELKVKNIKNIETGAQRIVKRIGGNVYRAFQADSLLSGEQKQKIYKEEVESVKKIERRASENLRVQSNLLQDDMLINLNFQKIIKNQDKNSAAGSLQDKNQSFSMQGDDENNDIIEQIKVSNHYLNRKASILRKDNNLGEVPTMVPGFKRRSTITEGMQRGKGRGSHLKALLPQYHFEGLTTLIQKFMSSFESIEQDIMQDKESWLHMFFSTSDNQDFDPFKLIPKRSKINKQESNHDVINQLLLLFVTKSETICKAIDQLIKHALDPVFHYLPKHMIEIHATLEWFKRPTILFYSYGSSNPVQRIVNSAKKAFRQTIRISCGKSNFEILKTKILQAAKGGNWLIIENLQMLPEDQILKIFKFIYDRIVYVKQSFPNLRIWITYYVETFVSNDYTPLDLPQSLSTKLILLTNDCFKIFVNKKSGIKEHLMNLYEPEVGYLLHQFEEHFYSVLLPKETTDEKQTIFQLHGNNWEKIIKESINKSKRKELVNHQPKQRFVRRYDASMGDEIQFSFKIFTLISAIIERSIFRKDNYGEFINENDIHVSIEDFKQSAENIWFLTYFVNKRLKASNNLLENMVTHDLSIYSSLNQDQSPSSISSLIRFFISKLKGYSIQAGKKNCYSLYENIDLQKKSQLTNLEFKLNLNLMPEQDILVLLGITQNQGLMRWFNETKDVLKGLSLHFSRYLQFSSQENRLISLFQYDRDQITLENRELLLHGFNKEIESFDQKQESHKHKVQQKEDYCFGDIDKIIELYLNQFDQKNLDELNGFDYKLQSLLKTQPSAQKYNLYKESKVNLSATQTNLKDQVLQSIVQRPSQKDLKFSLQTNDHLLHVDFIKDNISDIKSPKSLRSKPYGKVSVNSPKNVKKTKSEQLKQKQRNELLLLRKLYYDSVQPREQQMQRVFNIINYVSDLLPKILELPEFKIRLSSTSQSLPEEQSADEEEDQLMKALNGEINQLKRENSSKRPLLSLRDGRRQSKNTANLQINTNPRQLEVGSQRKLSVQSPRLEENKQPQTLVPQSPRYQSDNESREIDSPISPNVIRMRKFTMTGGSADNYIISNQGKQQITQALSHFDYQYKYHQFSQKNEQILKNFYTTEIIQINKIIVKLNKDLSTLKKYIQGYRIYSLDLHDLDLYECLLNNKVPGSWLLNGFFCKINITLVDWLELMTSKYAYLQRWAIESRGQPPPILKLTVLINPINLFNQMLQDYANQFGIYQNCLGFVIYFPKNKPLHQTNKSGLYLEGIIIRNGHINLQTGELEKSMIREFEQELPFFKLRVQAIRTSLLDTADSIPIVIRTSQSQKLCRVTNKNLQEKQFQNQGFNHAKSILNLIEKIQEDQVVPLDPASPMKIGRSKGLIKIKDMISQAAEKNEKKGKQENYIQIHLQKTFQTPANQIQSPQLRPTQRQGLGQLQVMSTQIGNIGGKKLKINVLQSSKQKKNSSNFGQNPHIKSNFFPKQNLNSTPTLPNIKNLISIKEGTKSKQQKGNGGLIKLFDIQSESSNDSQPMKNRHDSRDSFLSNSEKNQKQNLKSQVNTTGTPGKRLDSLGSNLLDGAAEAENQEDEEPFTKVIQCLLNEKKFKERGFDSDRQITKALRIQRKQQGIIVSSDEEDAQNEKMNNESDEENDQEYSISLSPNVRGNPTDHTIDGNAQLQDEHNAKDFKEQLNKGREKIKTKPEFKTVQMFDEIPEDSTLRYDVICPLIGQIESNNQFKLKFHFSLKSRHPQSYWNSSGLIAYFSNIRTI